MNHEFPTVIRLGAIIKFMLEKNPQKQFKKKDAWRIPVEKTMIG
jgi:hypothetical protein